MSADQLHEDRSGSEVDFDRASSLCHEGLHTHFAAVCVNPDGTDSLWLVDKQVLRDGDGGRR